MSQEPFRHPGWCVNIIVAAQVEVGERVLVVVDEPLVEQGAQLLAAVSDAGADARLELWAGKRPLTHLPHRVMLAAREADVALFLAHEPRPDEAGVRGQLMEGVLGHGGRELFLGFVDEPLLEAELSQPQPDLAPVAAEVLTQLRDAEEIHLRAPGGTDLLLRVAGRPWLTDAEPLAAGGYGNFPGGEVYVAPLEDGAEGVLVADLTVPYTVEGLVDAPVKLEFERGRARSITGGRAADALRDLVEKAGAGADVIAELGIGLHSGIRPRGHVMLDEKAAGTAHVAIGRNTGAYGGTNDASIHVDCIFSAPAIEVDGRPLELPR